MPRPKSMWFLPSKAQIKFMGAPVEFDPGMAKDTIVMLHKIGSMPFDMPKKLGVITNISEPKEDHIADSLSYAQMLAGGPKVYHTSKKQDWGTPQALYNLLAEEFPFSLDVCADQYNAKCPDFLTEEMNALELDWWGTVWMNPPYNETKVWVEKLIHEVDCGHVERGVALVGARPDTTWFWYASMYASEIRFLKGRLKFEIQVPHTEVTDVEFAVNTTGLTMVGIDIGKKVTTYVTDAAPFPSCLLIFDRTQTMRKTLWWDWKAKIQTQYAYQPLEKKQMVGKSPSKISQMSGDDLEQFIKVKILQKEAEMQAKIEASMHPPKELKESLGKALAEQLKAMQGDSELAGYVLKYLGYNPPPPSPPVPPALPPSSKMPETLMMTMDSLQKLHDIMVKLQEAKEFAKQVGEKKALKDSQGLLPDLNWK